jgi:hypothetical protein
MPTDIAASRDLLDAMHAEIDAFWNILAQQSVGVLIGSTGSQK